MKKFVYLAFLALSVCACGGDDDGPSGNNGGSNGGGSSATEQVFTGTTTNVTATTATITCNFSSASSASALQLGVFYSTERSTIDNYQGVLSLSTSVSGSSYQVELSNLNSNTIYYYRAYMVSGGKTYYGSVNSFTTSQGGLVTTGDATDITYWSATVTCSIKNTFFTNYKQLGVRYAESKDALENGYSQWEATSTLTNNTFTVTLTNLAEQTTYYYQARVTYQNTEYYGEIKSFTTLKNTVDYNGHEYVDLGLPSGTKWATMNVGASKPEDFGDYYAWGETTTKTSYTEDNYTLQGLTADELVSRGVVNVVNPSSYYPDYILSASYDVATVKWGSAWRMPTSDEINELKRYTTMTQTTQNGVEGFLLTSSRNKKTIFFPKAGYLYKSGLYNYGGSFWSSQLNNADYAYHIWLIDNLFYCSGQGERYTGSSVRPVTSY